jgi:hypothetical protein
MIFHSQNFTRSEEKFIISEEVHAISHPCLNKSIFMDFWRNFTFQASNLTASETDKYVFSVGDISAAELGTYDYSINITPHGICVCAKDQNTLVQGFVTLLDQFRAEDQDGKTVIVAECCQIKDSASIKNRMVHFCVFPETELWELQRFVRFCGALKYTHLVLEFWGMLRYDCLKELSWSCGFTKEEVAPIIKEANDLGLEIIPMFNHWGHASAGRVMHGKHVVLDQNPSLQTYFSEDGWCWDISKSKVKDLLRSVRAELIELCGEGSYFHVGCDEAYNFEFTQENMDFICDFINEISAEMSTQNRRIIAWGDMFLYRYAHYNPKNIYACNAPSPEVEEYLLSRLDKEIIIADWQYDAKYFPVETASVFTDAGFDCMLCPWDTGSSVVEACIMTARDKSLMGIMHTTWHTLSSGMHYVLLSAVKSFDSECDFDSTRARTYSATLLRKVMPSGGDYQRSGWSRHQIGFKW